MIMPGKIGRARIAHVPREPLQARRHRRMRLRRTPRSLIVVAARRRLALGVGRRAGESADHLSLRVEELHRDLLRRLLEVVVDRDRAIEAAQRVLGLVEMEVARRLEPALAQRRDVVHHVEAAPVRRDHQVALLHRDVVHRRVRQILPQRLPLRAVVERHVDAVLGAEIQQLRRA